MLKRALALSLALVGCGSGSSTDSGPHVPVAHVVTSGVTHRLEADAQLDLGPFAVGDAATITYTITDNPIGVGVDTITAQVAPGPFAVKMGSSISGTTPALAAGSYYVQVLCGNFVDDCVFVESITATY